ncbi:SMP-30/gluconolactonase/LRE family protein [Mycolicibacterium parafortuitum]|uniref:SMP-30/gluconolaconase/LRE domain-containing protein [Frankia sp. EAN1pec] n=1 Tax=Mycolicibacterium parafortuitum TaxID=39692 RepID=A0A375YSB0_MYCPF|nr:SMP-30/gluconolactonase/LRE family protein [Mycolicibacterium parafortuitum]ORB29012.1 gluconolaconase [Mycolicibacterium parafortuitum]SRX83909.1 SMP-30/gluconolaconase/LRE domain-containing protein [Frankia sp. EAN1pec] [Mycolicibacterium parafortuitum]
MNARYAAPSPSVAEGWELRPVTAPSRLFGANGLRTGPDGRVYIAQVTGSQISALDPSSGRVETVSAKGGDIIAPDDVAFGDDGTLFATEVMDGRVSARDSAGRTRVLRDDLPCANGITVHQGRLFVGECRDGGRLMELPLDGGAPRILLENLPSPNAMEVGPDGLLYYPLMTANEIWRVDPRPGTHSEPQRVAADLGVPDAVKFDADGTIVSTQVASGQVLRIDPRNGEKTVLAQLNPGLDNLTFVDGRLLVSNFTGEITEIGRDGRTSTLLPGGLNWPLDLTMSDGRLHVADGTYFYTVGPDGALQTVGMLFSPGYPGFLRGVTAVGGGEFVVTTSGGQVARYRPQAGETDYLATDFDQLYGVDVDREGTIVFAELGTGRVLALRGGAVETLAAGLAGPVGVAIAPDGAPLVAESGAGRVVRLTPGGVDTVVDGLTSPQGIHVYDGRLYIVDAAAKELVEFDLNTKARTTIAAGLPVGPPPGVEPKPLKGMPPFSGPQGPFAGVTAGPDGTLYVSADGDGSVLAVTRR